MIRITDIHGKTHLLNPSYITHVKEVTLKPYLQPERDICEIWVVSNAGYGTASVKVSETIKQVQKLINSKKQEL